MKVAMQWVKNILNNILNAIFELKLKAVKWCL